MDALRRIVRELRLSERGAERAAGISGAQLFVLQSLAIGAADSLNDLANRTATDQSSVSVVVKRLVGAKLVARRPSPEDGRRVELTLTPRGKSLLARCPEPTQARIVGALGKMTSAELAELTTGLSALVREMGIGEEPPRMFFEDAPRRSPAPRGARRTEE